MLTEAQKAAAARVRRIKHAAKVIADHVHELSAEEITAVSPVVLEAFEEYLVRRRDVRTHD